MAEQEPEVDIASVWAPRREVAELSSDEWEILESPDGDPCKRGTIRCAAGIGLLSHIDSEAPPVSKPDELVVTLQPNASHLEVVKTMGQALSPFYSSSRELQDATESIFDLDHDLFRRRRR